MSKLKQKMSGKKKSTKKAGLKTKLAKKQADASTPKRPSYREDNGRTISLDAAKERRWAHKETGMPTKIYDLRLSKRAARREGTTIPIRQWTPQNPGQIHNELESPFDLNRRSGQRIIWQELANTPNETLTRAELQERVNAAYKAEFPEYYGKKYSDVEFDTWTTTIVMNRAPFNAKIEALKQRVEVDTVAETVSLLTNVDTPRIPKKRGRKPGTKNKVSEPTVEADADNATEVNAPAEATA